MRIKYDDGVTSKDIKKQRKGKIKAKANVLEWKTSHCIIETVTVWVVISVQNKYVWVIVGKGSRQQQVCNNPFIVQLTWENLGWPHIVMHAACNQENTVVSGYTTALGISYCSVNWRTKHYIGICLLLSQRSSQGAPHAWGTHLAFHSLSPPVLILWTNKYLSTGEDKSLFNFGRVTHRKIMNATPSWLRLLDPSWSVWYL